MYLYVLGFVAGFVIGFSDIWLGFKVNAMLCRRLARYLSQRVAAQVSAVILIPIFAAIFVVTPNVLHRFVPLEIWQHIAAYLLLGGLMGGWLPYAIFIRKLNTSMEKQ